MEILKYSFRSERQVRRSAQVGVVGSGNLEVLIEPSCTGQAEAEVTTSLDGNAEIWKYVLGRFFQENPVCVRLEINDFGATPGVVRLRLLQALELAEAERNDTAGKKNEEKEEGSECRK